MATQEVQPSYRSTQVDDHYDLDRRSVERDTPPWSPAQIIALVIGVGYSALGIAAIARTGFDTGHIYTPQTLVWHFPHSPLLALIEIGFGVLMVISGVVPGGMRVLMGLLGATTLTFGIVVLAETAPNRLNHWLAVTHRSGALFVATGAVALLAALVSPVFSGSVRRKVVQDERVVS